MIEPEILKLIIPLIGVLIGWFLNSISGLRKERTETNQKLGRAISNLIEFNSELKQIQKTYDVFKNSSSDIIDYEEDRQMVNRRYTNRNDNFEGVYKSIEDISGLYPIEGMKLKTVVTNYIWSKKISLKESSKLGKDTYIQLLSIYEAAIDLDQKQLEKLIIKLAYKHSFSQWFKVRKYLNQTNKNLAGFKGSKLQKDLEELTKRGNIGKSNSPEEKLNLERISSKEKMGNKEIK